MSIRRSVATESVDVCVMGVGAGGTDADCCTLLARLERRGEGSLSGDDLESLLSSRSRLRLRRPAPPVSLGSLIPGKPSPDSPRDIGVAVGSIDTAERIGNTLSIEPGLRTGT